MKTITVGELRQNPTPMINDLEHGEPYTLTRHNHPVGVILPATSSTTVIPRKSNQAATTRTIPRHEFRTAESVDELLDADRGDR